MKIGDIQSALINLSKNRLFLKRYGLKSMTVDIDDMVDISLTLTSKHFQYSAYCTVSDEELETSDDWIVMTRVDKTSWDMVDDYLGDDIGETWEDENYFKISDGSEVSEAKEIAENLVNCIVSNFDEGSMTQRCKTLEKIIREIEGMNGDDRWIIARVAERLS